jgi:hypothetical protein
MNLPKKQSHVPPDPGDGLFFREEGAIGLWSLFDIPAARPYVSK